MLRLVATDANGVPTEPYNVMVALTAYRSGVVPIGAERPRGEQRDVAGPVRDVNVAPVVVYLHDDEGGDDAAAGQARIDRIAQFVCERVATAELR